MAREFISAAKWSWVTIVTRYGLGLLQVVIVARFVSPEEYGIAAIVLGISSLFALIAQLGFSQAIIGNRNVSKRLVDTILSFGLVVGVFAYAVLLSVSPFLSTLYNVPAFPAFLAVAGLAPLCTVAYSTPMAILQRRLQYKAQAAVAGVTALVTMVLAVPLAVLGGGVWALILPGLFGTVSGALCAFVLAGHRPLWALDWQKLRTTMNFGVWATVSNISNFFCNSGVPIIVGLFWAPTALGLFRFAQTQAQRPVELMGAVLSNNAFPILSKITGQSERLRNAVIRLTRISVHAIAPIYVVLIVGAQEILEAVFGSHWGAAAIPYQILCLIHLGRSFSLPANPVLYALRLPHLGARVAVLRAIGTAVAVAFAYHLSLNVVAFAAVFAAVDLACVVGYLALLLHRAVIPLSRYVVNLFGPSVLTLGFFVLCVTAREIATELEYGNWMTIFFLFIAALVYIPILLWNMRGEMRALPGFSEVFGR